MKNQLHIGASEIAINAARKALLDIIKAPVGDNVKVSAIDSFSKVCSVDHTTLSGCTISIGTEKSTKKKAK